MLDGLTSDARAALSFLRFVQSWVTDLAGSHVRRHQTYMGGLDFGDMESPPTQDFAEDFDV